MSSVDWSHRSSARSILVFENYEQVQIECDALDRAAIPYEMGFEGEDEFGQSAPGYEGYQLLTRQEMYYLRSDPIHLLIHPEDLVRAWECLELTSISADVHDESVRESLSAELLEAGLAHATEDPRVFWPTSGLFVPARHRAAVEEVLDRRARREQRRAYFAARSLRRHWRPERPLTLLATSLYAAWIFVFGLLARRGSPAFASGHLSYAGLQEGEIWRCVTSLSLHSGDKHLAGNLVLGSAILALASSRLGGGLAAFSMVVTGFLANLCNAYLHGPGYRSVGASTAVFVLVGLLAASDTARRQGEERRWSWRLAPMVLALLSLPFFGAGPDENTDVGAHTCGLVFGCLTGWFLGSWKAVTDILSPKWQVRWLVAAAVLTCLCWVLAFLANRA